MIKEAFLQRAQRSLRLARLHHCLRDVSAEVTDVREALAAAGSQPAAIGITEIELIELVRAGYMAEARITFDLAVDSAASEIEKEFFFTELVGLITRATFAATPAARTVRDEPLTAQPAGEPVVKDEELATYLLNNDPFTRNEPSGAHDLKAIMDGVPDSTIASLDFACFDGGTLDITHRAIPIPDDDPDPVIELSTEDLYDGPEIEIVEQNPEYDHYAVKFFGEKDAIALGLFPAPVASPSSEIRHRAVPPPLPREVASAAADDA